MKVKIALSCLFKNPNFHSFGSVAINEGSYKLAQEILDTGLIWKDDPKWSVLKISSNGKWKILSAVERGALEELDQLFQRIG